ncbi:anthrone oxygenase family protein [Streptomyces cacaoi]|uniref:anthrone oxygenase family protein n=1 Tax=Streptomyces cacaoi TaxID=1898 RepID=UPI00374A4FA5
MLDVLEVCTTVVAGVMVGVEFSVAFVINPILNRLPEDSSVLGRAHGARLLGALMPAWYLASLALATVWAVAGWHHPGAGLVAIAVALLILSVVMSLLLLVPVNSRVRTWTPENRPEDWKEQTNRWDRFHHARVAVLIAAFALLTTAFA